MDGTLKSRRKSLPTSKIIIGKDLSRITESEGGDASKPRVTLDDVPKGISNKEAIQIIVSELEDMLSERQQFENITSKRTKKFKMAIHYLTKPSSVFTLAYIIVTAVFIDYKALAPVQTSAKTDLDE